MSFHGQVDKFRTAICQVYYASKDTLSYKCFVLVNTQAGIDEIEALRKQTEALPNFVRWL